MKLKKETMTTATTATKSLNILFNDRPVDFVCIEYITWHVDSESDFTCTSCHCDYEQIDTADIEGFLNNPEYPEWKGITKIQFKADSIFVSYEALDANDNFVRSRMLPLHHVSKILQ
jgi:hypothetical protein